MYILNLGGVIYFWKSYRIWLKPMEGSNIFQSVLENFLGLKEKSNLETP